MKKKFMFAFALIFIISFVSSNGLVIENNNQVATKTFGVNQNFVITLKNNFSQSFFNISIQDNEYISFPQFSQLLAGDSVNITATIKKDDYNKNLLLDIYGLFLNTVGIRNETHLINIDWDSQSRCDITLVEGDKINFTNTGQYDTNLLLNFGEITIPAQSSYVANYNQVGTDFWFRRKVGALQFERCTITVNPATGYVNDPAKNAKLNLTLSSAFESTSISVQIPVKNYNISFNRQDEGAMVITNTGNKILKNLTLSGDWFYFAANGFDLDPGYSKTVVYTIKPFGIDNTSKTNQNYVKEVKFSGNIVEQRHNFTIFVPYAVIDQNSSSGSNMTIKDILCAQYPELCEPQIIYRYYDNGSLVTSNVTITDEEWRDYNLELYKLREEMRTVLNSVKESNSNTTSNFGEIKGDVKSLSDEQKRLADEKSSQASLVTSFLLIILLAAISAFTYYFMKYYKLKKAREKVEKW